MDSNIIKPGNQTLEEFYCFNFFFLWRTDSISKPQKKKQEIEGGKYYRVNYHFWEALALQFCDFRGLPLFSPPMATRLQGR